MSNVAPITEEVIAELLNDLDNARSVVFISAQALDAGDTDLELQSATALKRAFETIDTVYDRLLALRVDQSKYEREIEQTAERAS
jgi:hypothetical protein